MEIIAWEFHPNTRTVTLIYNNGDMENITGKDAEEFILCLD